MLNQINMATMQVPGWRIEQSFSNGCLIGNWNEERRKFQRGKALSGNSTHRIDFQHLSSKPRRNTRRKAEMHNDGLDPKHLFSHHGHKYSNNMISWYDQHMNQRELVEGDLPEKRTWDGKKMVWAPERTDFPLQGRSTNFGLKEQMQEKWEQEEKDEVSTRDVSTSYGRSFKAYSADAMEQSHRATPKPLSSHFHTHGVNKNLPLRNTHTNMAPEHPALLLEPTDRTVANSCQSMRQHISRSNYSIPPCEREPMGKNESR